MNTDRQSQNAENERRPGRSGADFLEKRRAVLEPLRTDDLAETVSDFIGQEIAVQFTGRVDFESPYHGQGMWSPIGEGPVVAWIPECDLRFVEGEPEEISPGRWR